MTTPRPLVIDTDLNFPSDDFQALLIAVSEAPERLFGVSAVAGNTFAEECWINIAHALHACGAADRLTARGPSFERFSGRRAAARAELSQGYVSFIGSHGKADAPRLDDHPAPHVLTVASLAELLERAPRPVELVCLGPLSNLAEVLERSPSAREKIGSVSMMGANVSVDPRHPKKDFNVWYDPHAARVVFDSGLPIRVFSYELCRAHRFDPSLLARLCSVRGGLAEWMSHDLATLAEQHGPAMPMCDQLAMLGTLHPDAIVQTRPMAVEVVLDEGPLWGSTRATRSSASAIEYVERVDHGRITAAWAAVMEGLGQAAIPLGQDDFLSSAVYRLDLQPPRAR